MSDNQETILNHLDDEDGFVRGDALKVIVTWSVLQQQAPGIQEAVLQRLTDKEVSIRKTTLKTIKMWSGDQLNNPNVRKTVLNRLNDENEDKGVREAALRCMKVIQTYQSNELPQFLFKTSIFAYFVLVMIGLGVLLILGGISMIIGTPTDNLTNKVTGLVLLFFGGVLIYIVVKIYSPNRQYFDPYFEKWGDND